MSAKKYVACVAGFLFVFMAGNLALWHCAVKDSFIQGDLNRMGSFASTAPLTPEAEYLKRHVELKYYLASGKKESFDVLTIGDSFSNGGGRVFYQDCLTEKYGLNVLNARFRNHCLEDLYILIESGMLDEIHPSAVILESVGRYVQDRLGKYEITPSKITHADAERILQRWNITTSGQIASGFFAPIMGEAIRNFLSSSVYHAIDGERLGSEVYIKELDREFFTNPGYENTLLYYYEDLQYLNTPPQHRNDKQKSQQRRKNPRRQKH